MCGGRSDGLGDEALLQSLCPGHAGVEALARGQPLKEFVVGVVSALNDFPVCLSVHLSISLSLYFCLCLYN